MRELILPVAHCLLARHGWTSASEGDTVIPRHWQCRMFLRSTLGGGIKTLPATSTAAAARDVAAGLKEWGAIASKHAAGVYGLNIIRENIQGNYQNSTRFVVLSKEQREPTGCDKTSIVFSVDDKPGSLYHALKIFADSRINLTKIESRPMRTNLGEYLFVVDLEGHIRDGIVERALNRLAEQSKYFSVQDLAGYASMIQPSGGLCIRKRNGFNRLLNRTGRIYLRYFDGPYLQI